jgi:hypothetical protein
LATQPEHGRCIGTAAITCGARRAHQCQRPVDLSSKSSSDDRARLKRDTQIMPKRYDLREDSDGWTVFDIFTGEPVVISLVPQTGLDIQDADELAGTLGSQDVRRRSSPAAIAGQHV